jgi:hypothetical protein
MGAALNFKLLSMRLALACWVFAAGWPAHAVIIRHDRPDAAYQAKARELPSYCRIQAPDGGGR